MMGLSVWHLGIFVLVAILLFGGGGKISSLMGDIGKGIKELKNGLIDDEKIDEPKKLSTTTPDKTTDKA